MVARERTLSRTTFVGFFRISVSGLASDFLPSAGEKQEDKRMLGELIEEAARTFQRYRSAFKAAPGSFLLLSPSRFPLLCWETLLIRAGSARVAAGLHHRRRSSG